MELVDGSNKEMSQAYFCVWVPGNPNGLSSEKVSKCMKKARGKPERKSGKKYEAGTAGS